MDDLSIAVNGGPKEWANYHRNHRELVSLNDWQMARRSTSGQNFRQFLLKCAYFFAVESDWTVEEFSHECEISISTANEFNRRMLAVYPKYAGLRGGSFKTKQKKASTQSFLAIILKEKERQDAT